MPWSVKKTGNGYAVIKDKTGKVVARHSTRKKALAHLRALYANVKE